MYFLQWPMTNNFTGKLSRNFFMFYFYNLLGCFITMWVYYRRSKQICATKSTMQTFLHPNKIVTFFHLKFPVSEIMFSRYTCNKRAIDFKLESAQPERVSRAQYFLSANSFPINSRFQYTLRRFQYRKKSKERASRRKKIRTSFLPLACHLHSK
jgi:hypothetical protein